MSSPIPANFHFEYTVGQCLTCEKPATNGLFCPDCLPAPKAKNQGISLDDQLNLLANMVNSTPERDLKEYLSPNHEWEQPKDDPLSFLPQLLEPDVVSNLEVGVIAYIRSSDLFLTDEYLWVLANTKVVYNVDLYHTAKIKKDKSGLIEAVYSTVDKDAIYGGYPEESSSVPSLIVHFVSSF